MKDSIEKQLEKLAEEKKQKGAENPLTEMIETAEGRGEFEGIRTVTSEEAFSNKEKTIVSSVDANGLFSGEDITGYTSKNKRSKETFEKYQAGIEAKISEDNAKNPEEIKAAVDDYFHENPNHKKSQAGKLILKKLSSLESPDKGQNNLDTETTIEVGPKPTSLDDFEKHYKISKGTDKVYYSDESRGVDIEITGYDPISGEVKLIEHSINNTREDGMNVLDLSEGAVKPLIKNITFKKLRAIMENCVLQGSQTDTTIERKKIESPTHKAKKEKAEKTQLSKEEERLLKDVFAPYAEEAAQRIEKPVWASGYSADQRNLLKEIQREGFWEYKIFTEIEKFNSELAGKKKTKETGIGKEHIDQFVKQLKEEVDKKIKPVVEIDEPEMKDDDEKIEQQEINEEEQGAVDRVFSPYAKIYLDDVESNAPEGLSEERINQVKAIEKDRFFGSVLPTKMVESKFIRKQAIESAINVVDASLEKEISSDEPSK